MNLSINIACREECVAEHGIPYQYQTVTTHLYDCSHDYEIGKEIGEECIRTFIKCA